MPVINGMTQIVNEKVRSFLLIIFTCQIITWYQKYFFCKQLLVFMNSNPDKKNYSYWCMHLIYSSATNHNLTRRKLGMVVKMLLAFGYELFPLHIRCCLCVGTELLKHQVFFNKCLQRLECKQHLTSVIVLQQNFSPVPIVVWFITGDCGVIILSM
jgi:hypothetical protein